MPKNTPRPRRAPHAKALPRRPQSTSTAAAVFRAMSPDAREDWLDLAMTDSPEVAMADLGKELPAGEVERLYKLVEDWSNRQ